MSGAGSTHEIGRARMLAAFAAIYIIWGSTPLSIALAVQTIPPFLMMAIRCELGGAILLALAAWGGASPPPAATWVRALLGGVLLFVGCHGMMAWAEQTVSSGIAAVMLATMPFWFVLIDCVLPGAARPRLAAIFGLIPGFAGVGLIAWAESGAKGGAGPVMLAVLLFGALSWCLGSLTGRGRPKAVPASQFSGIQLVCGGVALLAVSAARGELAGFSPAHVSPVSWGGMLYLALFGTVVAFAAYVWLLDHVPAALVSTCTFVNPVIAVLLGWAVLGEHVGVDMLAGSVLVVGSVIFVWRASAISTPPASRSIPQSPHGSRTSTHPSPSCGGSGARAAAGGSDGP
jgi:drug/metabolite transporter (DMT)-like permease